jgi:hypothetical protein
MAPLPSSRSIILDEVDPGRQQLNLTSRKSPSGKKTEVFSVSK